ncbi:salt tolerance down-regulator-domain-containing protein [Lanmaoa asiatica]|nr:salt tolerance down-regulator-domain-containing protein [Lanmaoa asiatica]
MAVGKSQKAKQPAVAPSSTPNSRSPVPATPVQPAPPPANGKRHKKKRGKGKGKELQNVALQDGDLCDVPSLEVADMPLPPISGLSPQLESVHITTTGYVAASATALARPGVGVTTQLHGEILATQNDLRWRNIEVQSNGRTGTKATPPSSQPQLPKPNGANGPALADDEYWSSFPPHIKNFAQTMYNIAQQMVQSDTYLKNGTATATATMATKGIPGYPPGAYPTLPFDPSIFSDPAFTLSVEQAAAAALGAVPPAPGQPPRGPLPQTNVVLLNEFESGEHEFAGEDYYSEDEVDGGFEDEDLEDEFDLQPHPARPPAGPHPSNPDAVAHVVLSYGETPARPPTTTAPRKPTDVSIKTTTTTRPREPVTAADTVKQNQQRKGKDNAENPAVAPVAPSVPNPAPAADTRSANSAPESAPEKGRGRPTATVDLTKRPPLTVNAMPAPRPQTKENISANPPPSSRAQGKQPMSYAPTTAATTTTNSATAAIPGNGQQPARTARAASKAPITAHTYTHNHAHHHPSPPSSNASVSHKPRPPAGPGPTKGSQNNSKIWSTSTTEERERIKQFWLGLGEDERRNLVKIEKDTVLRKMKEQQKHSCSCAVCGRKRLVPFFTRHGIGKNQG